eukprot:Phypoly_transcript_10025.p1 GENE.Phypoly_transcript_10025~~Phypoly_transcript_10025.p1  ORF type:complete len:349 (+),score=28.22 Phypoly_transcript_10025:119-1165(+)
MECINCHAQKLSNEFPKSRLSRGCNHRPCWCLRCLVEYPEKRCPECGLDYETKVYDDLRYLLSLITQSEVLKPPPAPVVTPPSRSITSHEAPTNVTFRVSLIGGESREYTKLTNVHVLELMKQLEHDFRVSPSFQRLMFNGLQLKAYSDHGEITQLRDYSLPNGASLQLMKILLSVSQETPYENLVFKLTWQKHNKYARNKYLDASCFGYRGRELVAIVDFRNKNAIAGMSHSGPAQNRMKHILVTNLTNVDPSVSHLFFVMSACHASTLQEFEAPTVSLTDFARPQQQISSYSFVTQGNSMAVIMCCMKRTEKGWEAFSLGQPTDGYCYFYTPIQNTISRLFDARVV